MSAWINTSRLWSRPPSLRQRRGPRRPSRTAGAPVAEAGAVTGIGAASSSSGPSDARDVRALAAGVAFETMAGLAGAVLEGAAQPDPAESLDRGVALSQVWAEQGQQGGAVVAGDMRVLAAQTGQSVAGRLSAVSPIETGRIDRSIADFVRVLQVHASAAPHVTAPAVVEPLARALAAGFFREEGPMSARSSAVEQFVRMVEASTETLRRAD